MPILYNLILNSQPNKQSYVKHHSLILPLYLEHPKKGNRLHNTSPAIINKPEMRTWKAAGIEQGDPFDIRIARIGTPSMNSKNYSHLVLSFIDSQTQLPVKVTDLDLNLLPNKLESALPSPTSIQDASTVEIFLSQDSIIIREISCPEFMQPISSSICFSHLERKVLKFPSRP